MDTSGTEFRVAGIVDTGGSEDSIIYATNADVNKLTGITRGVDVIEYSAGASDLAGLVSSINDMTPCTSRHSRSPRSPPPTPASSPCCRRCSGSSRWWCWC